MLYKKHTHIKYKEKISTKNLHKLAEKGIRYETFKPKKPWFKRLTFTVTSVITFLLGIIFLLFVKIK